MCGSFNVYDSTWPGIGKVGDLFPVGCKGNLCFDSRLSLRYAMCFVKRTFCLFRKVCVLLCRSFYLARNNYSVGNTIIIAFWRLGLLLLPISKKHLKKILEFNRFAISVQKKTHWARMVDNSCFS